MILDEIVARKKRQLAEEIAVTPYAILEKRAVEAPPVRDFEAALRMPGLSVIAEVKKASPSKGVIAADFRPVETAEAYEKGGAAAISVLTERHFFLGGDEVLTDVRSQVSLPVLRKDFIISGRQIVEARAIGADAVLLIAAILNDDKLRHFYRLATELKMHCLFEAHTEEETRRVAALGARIIGINHRNLNTFEVDLHQFERMAPFIPKGAVAVAESGIRDEKDAMWLASVGADAILVGETLMRAIHAGETIGMLRRGTGT